MMSPIRCENGLKPSLEDDDADADAGFDGSDFLSDAQDARNTIGRQKMTADFFNSGRDGRN